MAGVANTGRDENWTGHDFGQANWYAYGRLAWNPGLTADAIADEWIAMTWSHDAGVTAAIRSLMLGSRETYVDYTMPLGLHHLIGGDHYAPMPENDDPRRADWSAIYYHRADRTGIGFDRTTRGSNAVGQYRSPLARAVERPGHVPGEPAALVPPAAVGLPPRLGRHALGGAGASLPPRRGAGRADGHDLGLASRQGG